VVFFGKAAGSGEHPFAPHKKTPKKKGIAMRRVDPKRLVFVENLYCKGVATRAIEQRTAAEFRCSRRTVRNYLRKVRERLGRAFEKQSKPAALARTESLLAEALELARAKGDPRVLADIAMRMAEVHGALPSRSFSVKADAGTGLADALGAVMRGGAGGDAKQG
jgi:hypothetical protein